MRLTRWVLGLLLGCVVGAAFLEFPTIAVLAALACVVWGLAERARPSGMAGLLLGSGGAVAVALTAANARCAAFNEVPDQGCFAPDITPFLVPALVLVAMAVALTILAARRGSSPEG